MTQFAVANVPMAGPVADNLDRMHRLVAGVMQRFPWTDMILFGELAAFGPRLSEAQSIPGPAEDYFRALARKHQIWLVPGSIYEMKDKQIHNTAPVIDRSGAVVARHRKIYPFLPYESGVTPERNATTPVEYLRNPTLPGSPARADYLDSLGPLEKLRCGPARNAAE